MTDQNSFTFVFTLIWKINDW